MDAAEIAARWKSARNGGPRCKLSPPHVDILLDALEQAQKERDETLGDRLEFTRQVMTFDKLAEESISEIESLTAQRDQAQKDAKDARALLGEALETYSFTLATSDLGDRIEAMLNSRPAT